MPRFITLQEAVDNFDVGIATLYRHLKTGRLQRYKRGGREGRGIRTFIDRAELRQLLKPQPVRRWETSYPGSSQAPSGNAPPKLRRRSGEGDQAFAARVEAAREAPSERLHARRFKR
jgi:hypothetical protein